MITALRRNVRLDAKCNIGSHDPPETCAIRLVITVS